MRRWLTLASIGVLLMAFLAAPTAVTQDNQIVIGTTDRITNLSPANSYDYWTWHTFQDTSDGLLELPPNSTDLAPALATDYSVSDDGTTYTFQLREGVTHTDGTPFNCQTMAWSLARNITLNGPEGGVGLIGMIDSISCGSETLNTALGESPTQAELQSFLDADVENNHEMVVTINAPDATFLARMAGTIGAGVALSPESTPAGSFAEGEYAGTGPYQLAEYEPEVQTVYEAYGDYWNEDYPRTSRIVNRFYSDASALRAAIEGGEIDVAYRTMQPADILDLQARADSLGLQVQQGESSLSVRYMVFNVTAEPFDDPAVRRAVSYAVDRQRIVQDIFFGLNDPLYSMVPPGLWSSVDAFPERDLGQARQLLQQAGYSEEDPLEVTLWYSPLHYGSSEADVATVLKDSLEATGMMSVELSSLEWGAYTSAFASGELGMFLLGWYPDFIDPDNFLAPWLTESPQGLGTYLNQGEGYNAEVYDQFTSLLSDAKATTVQSARAGFYEEAQNLLAESVVLLPLWQNNSQHVAISKEGVDGIVLDASMNFRTWLLQK